MIVYSKSEKKIWSDVKAKAIRGTGEENQVLTSCATVKEKYSSVRGILGAFHLLQKRGHSANKKPGGRSRRSILLFPLQGDQKAVGVITKKRPERNFNVDLF